MGFFKDTAQTGASRDQIKAAAKVAKDKLAKHGSTLSDKQRAFYEAKVREANGL